jgi:hypothetical protein
MKTILSIILSTFLLFGCATVELDEPVVELIKPMQFDKEVLELCPALDDKVITPTFENVQAAYADTANKYAICANKQYNSVKIIKEFGNIK